jgi:hypothetical protein
MAASTLDVCSYEFFFAISDCNRGYYNNISVIVAFVSSILLNALSYFFTMA